MIASTTCCWLVSVRLYSATFWPSRSTVIESATSKTSCRLCEMRITARPCSPSRLTSASTWRVCATPSAAVGSSRIDELGVPHHGLGHGDRLTLAAGEAGDRLADGADRGHGEAASVSWALASIAVSSRRRAPSTSSRPRYMFWTTSRLSREREVLVDDLDPEPRGVLGPVDVHGLALEADLAAVDRVDARDALDERRLAGAVVADEGHDLARRHVEVDLEQRLDRAEALRDSLQFQDRCVGHV